jgi:hypothetical protein
LGGKSGAGRGGPPSTFAEVDADLVCGCTCVYFGGGLAILLSLTQSGSGSALLLVDPVDLMEAFLRRGAIDDGVEEERIVSKPLCTKGPSKIIRDAGSRLPSTIFLGSKGRPPMSSSPFLVGPDLINAQAGRRTSGVNQSQHTASPARGAVMTFSGSHSSPGNSQHNVPSPATFAKMAAAVGVQNPLLEDPRRASGNSTEIVTVKQQDAYAEMISQSESFLNVQLSQLETAGNAFFDQ